MSPPISHSAMISLLISFVLGIASTAFLTENDSPAKPAKRDLAQATALKVYPEAVNITHARDQQSLVVQALMPNGTTVDVTEQVSWKIGNEKAARLENQRLLPVADGVTELTVSLGDLKAQVPVSVTNSATRHPISFELDVMPVFMKAGCNSGGCHGAARGKDGFRLSLYGFDPKGDYHRLTREMAGRRIDLSLPENCLLIEKAAGEVSHTGGQLIKKDDVYYRTLVEWLNDGAPTDAAAVPKVEKIEVYPPSAILEGAGAAQKLTVRAVYADGNDRDVTELAYFLSSNDNSAKVDQTGLISADKRGEAFVMARFETHTVGIPVTVLPADSAFQWKTIPENNYVDTLINQKLKTLQIQPSDVCSDAEFIRRATLDICGALPTGEELSAFVSNTDPDKRAKLVDQLLERKEFVEIWVMKWAELLQVRSTNNVSYKSTLLYYNWLQEQIASNVPIDQMIISLLGSEGGTFSSPATNYYQNERDTLKVSENVAQVFLGMRLQCAQCHNHPFDRWTMDDYYGFASFFAQIGRKASGKDPRETMVYDNQSGETKHPITGQNMKPKFLGGATPDLKGKDRRMAVAQWITSADNPYFSKNLSNLVWAHFFGRGIVDEVDDVRVSNPPSNPELLDKLGKKLTEYKYDFKQLVRDICNSRTYQLATQTNPTNETDNTNFSHAYLRRIRSEVLLDVISQVTGTQNKFRGLPLGARAVQIADGNTSNYFLTTFGRSSRASVCSCEVKMDPNLSQALHLINGSTVQSKIQSGGLLKQQLDAGIEPLEITKDLYLRCLSRQPNESELVDLKKHLDQGGEPLPALEDVFWALLNSQEFVFNH
ncbi:MAG: DUF1549 domain-containing protein [Pirellulaceae bacterium]|nr:DUF1549 domain-containing protein [Pirellulaceae bacterium]MDG2102475.1 DUF1549 domain-containing protein [Pirellulaceae bacterium]